MIETKKKQAGQLVPLDALFSTADAIIRSSPTNLSEHEFHSALAALGVELTSKGAASLLRLYQ